MIQTAVPKCSKESRFQKFKSCEILAIPKADPKYGSMEYAIVMCYLLPVEASNGPQISI